MDKTNSSWLKTFSIGFSIISFGITLAIIGYIVLTTKQNQPANNQPNIVSPTISQLSPTPTLTTKVIPTVDPSITSNWKTYAGKHYSFKYPDTWSSNVSDEKYFESGILIHTIDVNFSDFSHFNKGAIIYRDFTMGNPQAEFVNLDAVIARFVRRKDESLISENNLVIDTQSAKERVLKGNNVGEVFVAFQYPNNNGYSWLVMLSSLDSFDTNQNTLDQILSTFKFTK